MTITASRLLVTAAKLPLEGVDLVDHRHEGCRCAVCGGPLNAGEPVDSLVLPKSFTNHAALAIPGGDWRCGACTAIMGRSIFQMGAATVLITEQGVYPIDRKEHRAWALMHPHAGPFAISIQTAKQQHVVWRAPVSLSPEVVLLRVGEQLFRIRKRLLLEAIGEAKKLDAINNSKGRPVKAGIENPFVNDWKFQNANGGRFKSWVLGLLRDGAISQQELPALFRLNGAEAWVLTAALHDTPVQPESIASRLQ